MPVFTNSQQVTLVLQSLLLGVGIGAVYDMLRALRLHFRCGWAGAALFDTMFWAIVLAALFEFGLIAAAGQPRGFVLLTAAGGVGFMGVAKGTVKNSVGAGDSMVAGFIAGYLDKRDYAYALKLGTASGSATAFSEGIATRKILLNFLRSCNHQENSM